MDLHKISYDVNWFSVDCEGIFLVGKLTAADYCSYTSLDGVMGVRKISWRILLQVRIFVLSRDISSVIHHGRMV